MPTLIESLCSGFDTVNNKPTNSGAFQRDLIRYRSQIVDEYLKYHIDLNKLIADVVKKNDLNDDQMKRIVEEVNNQVYLIKYNELKNCADRDVEFDLASANGVKSVIQGVNGLETTHTASTYYSYGSLEKSASWENNDMDEKRDAFNYTAYEFSDAAPDTYRSKDSIIKEKLANDLIELNQQLKEASENVANEAFDIANALVMYDMRGVSAQSVFEHLCKKADVNSRAQTLIKTAYDKTVESMKQSKAIPDCYDSKIDFVNTQLPEDKYSLGSHSFLKTAGVALDSELRIPQIMTERSKISDINDLVKIANALDEYIVKSRGINEERTKFLKNAGISEELAEKIATSGAGLSGFFKSLTGSSARSAKKNLNKATQVLNEKMANPGVQKANSVLNSMEKAKKNVDVHSRMQNANQILDRAVNKYNTVAKGVEPVIQENMLRAKYNPIRYINPKANMAKLERHKAKKDLVRAQKMVNNQEKRIRKDIGVEITNSQRQLRNAQSEVDIDEARKGVEQASRAYEKAIGSRKKARTVAGIGIGAGIGLKQYNDNKKKEEMGATYY